MKMIYRPTFLTLLGVATTIAAISGTTGYILGRATSIPGVLPVHFDDQGIADRFVPASYAIILVPVWIQVSLAIVFGAIAGVLLYRAKKTRSAVEHEVSRQERERMLVTAEAISLLAAIWVTFQGLLAVRLIMMWQLMCCGLGSIYYQSLVVCIVLSAVVGCESGGQSSVSEARRARDRGCALAVSGRLFQPAGPGALRAAAQRRGVDRQFRPAASHCISCTCPLRQHLGAHLHFQGPRRGIKPTPGVFLYAEEKPRSGAGHRGPR